MDPAIKFLVENNQQDGAIPFLDTVVKPETDNTLSLTVYRKPMHADHYLQWDSHHNLVPKYSVTSTLTQRARTVCTKPELLNQEIQHIREVERKSIINNQEESNEGNNQSGQSGGNTDNTTEAPEGRDTTKMRYNKGHTVILYTQGLGESIKNMQEVLDQDPFQRKKNY